MSGRDREREVPSERDPFVRIAEALPKGTAQRPSLPPRVRPWASGLEPVLAPPPPTRKPTMDIDARPVDARPIVTRPIVTRPIVEESEKSGAGVQPVPFLPTVIVSDDEPPSIAPPPHIRANAPTARKRRRPPRPSQRLRRQLPLLFLVLSIAAFCAAVAVLAARS